MVAQEQRRQRADAQIVQNHTPAKTKQSHWHKSPGMMHQHDIHSFQIARNDFHTVAAPDGAVAEHLLEADVRASQPPTGTDAAWFQGVQRFIFGKPIAEQMASLQRLNPVRALAILSSDALSSVAYGTEASLAVLVTAGAAALSINLAIGVVIVLLMVIVGNSYRQTIFAYPQGGGSYTVARQNLGTTAGLVAAASLLVDYILTVSVSVAAGIDQLASAFQQLDTVRVPLELLVILFIIGVNLRGLRESGTFFAIPTYLFLGSFGLMLTAGIVRAVAGGPTHAVAPTVSHTTGTLTIMLILTAFASGCSAMTGVEAISNGVPIFTGKDVKERSRNAARTLMVMITILVSLFLGTTYLAWRLGASPNATTTITAQIAHVALGNGWLFYVVQIATLLILIFAANTSFAGFPLLAAILSRDKFLPPLFAFRGERLAYSAGILILGTLSALILLAFRGNVSDLINLYALGVFTSFTLSQLGMVRHWQHLREAIGNRGWRMFANGLGAVTTAIVTLVIVIAKFDRGAWVVLILVPLLVAAFLWLRRYYTRDRIFVEENFPQVTASVAIVPIFNVRDARTELRYAAKVAPHAIAVHIVADEAEAESFHRRWDAIMGDSTTGHEPQLEIIISPYRNIVFPMARFVEWVAQEAPPEETFAILLPQSEHLALWERPLHRRIAQRVRAVLEREQDGHRFRIVNLPYRLAPPAARPRLDA